MTDERFEKLCELISDFFDESSDSNTIERISVITSVIGTGKNLLRYYYSEPERGINNLVTYLQAKIEDKILTDKEAIVLLKIILANKELSK